MISHTLQCSWREIPCERMVSCYWFLSSFKKILKEMWTWSSAESERGGELLEGWRERVHETVLGRRVKGPSTVYHLTLRWHTRKLFSASALSSVFIVTLTPLLILCSCSKAFNESLWRESRYAPGHGSLIQYGPPWPGTQQFPCSLIWPGDCSWDKAGEGRVFFLFCKEPDSKHLRWLLSYCCENMFNSNMLCKISILLNVMVCFMAQVCELAKDVHFAFVGWSVM